MDKIAEALGPYPGLQLVFGLAVLGFGLFSIYRGAVGKDSSRAETQRQQWEAYKQLEEIEQSQRRLVSLMERNNELLSQVIEAVNRWGSFFFNRTQA
jgi:hypothetical protein